jgi:hypothetical protein
MDKVYCDDCAHLTDDDHDSYCESPKNYDMSSNWRRKFRDYILKPEVKNANNDCKDFKLVWYKRIFR